MTRFEELQDATERHKQLLESLTALIVTTAQHTNLFWESSRAITALNGHATPSPWALAFGSEVRDTYNLMNSQLDELGGAPINFYDNTGTLHSGKITQLDEFDPVKQQWKVKITPNNARTALENNLPTEKLCEQIAQLPAARHY